MGGCACFWVCVGVWRKRGGGSVMCRGCDMSVNIFGR